MRLSIATLLLASYPSGAAAAAAFAPPKPSPGAVPSRAAPPPSMALMDDDAPSSTRLTPPTPAELLARARRRAGLPEEEDPLSQFSQGLLRDMQQCLLKLERRVKDGPGSLTPREVMEFEAAAGRILDDMTERVRYGPRRGTSGRYEEDQPLQMAGGDVSVDTTSEIIDTSEGGMGGNTYSIPGMDRMTGEEYRRALQQSVIDRQEQRRRANSGVIGNRAAHSYLNQLGWGGAEANLAGVGSEARPVSARPPAQYGFQNHMYSKPKPELVPDDPIPPPAVMQYDPVEKFGGNTYNIPGMDEMTGEEYRRALQQSVIDMQEERRRAMGGMVGNRASHSYLDQLGWGGAESSLAGRPRGDGLMETM